MTTLAVMLSLKSLKVAWCELLLEENLKGHADLELPDTTKPYSTPPKEKYSVHIHVYNLNTSDWFIDKENISRSPALLWQMINLSKLQIGKTRYM